MTATTAPTLSEVLATTGATYRQLDFWVRRGYLKPRNATPGSGFPRRWPTEEVTVAAAMTQLVAAGLTVEAAHHAARNGGQLPGGKYQVIERVVQAVATELSGQVDLYDLLGGEPT